MARSRTVFIVEEPIFHDSSQSASLQVAEHSGVTVLTPWLPMSDGLTEGFGPATNPAIRSLLALFFNDESGRRDATVWYYTPMALGALPDNILANIVVFDAMDELSNFLGAPQDLRDRENILLREADLVFAGGPGLYEQRKHRNPRTYCFPSGVDAAHFSVAANSAPADIASLPKPIVGFYGVLDERIDFDLLDALAVLRPQWSIALIGPVAKIDERTLPKRNNLHYLGMRTYLELPHYLQQFDAAILPFAINDATKFISPTKTLEYLAGDKPIVSTPIKDVMDLYGSVVEIASAPADFVNAIERLWNEPATTGADRRRRTRAVLARHDWNVIVAKMEQLMSDAVRERASLPVLASHPATWNDRTPRARDRTRSEVGD
ncbi:MAG: glycosyltransferase [Chloroflexota bacterium]|nr:glycosyltransferase [Chloroflexota bacterium]